MVELGGGGGQGETGLQVEKIERIGGEGEGETISMSHETVYQIGSSYYMYLAGRVREFRSTEDACRMSMSSGRELWKYSVALAGKVRHIESSKIFPRVCMI